MQEKKIFVRTNDIPSLKRVNRKFHVAVDRATTAAKKVYIYIYIYIYIYKCSARAKLLFC